VTPDAHALRWPQQGLGFDRQALQHRSPHDRRTERRHLRLALHPGGFDSTEDALFQACKVRGTTLYIYVRKTDKLSTAAWATADEIYLGGSVITGTPKASDTAYIKYEVPLFPQDMRAFIAVA
jgi:hypothetical protein